MEQTCSNNSDNSNKMNNRMINKIVTALIVIAATLGIAMAGGLVQWQEVASFFKGDETAKTAETKAKTEAADPSHGATHAHTTAFSGMPFTLTVEGATVHGEAGSLAEAAELSLSALDSVPPMAAGMVNVTKGAAGYRLSPSGMGFSRPVRVELGYDSLLLPKGHSAKEIRTFLYDTDNKRWEALPMDSVMEGAQKTGAQTTKAGELVNAIVQLPELPEAQSFTPSMLSKLEAAHPASGITLMEAPQANSQGTANLNYPITVPAGRGGLQPNLSISYSSEAGNGLLGMGWDMQLPAIMVDSKWGVPRYDGTYETECYSYNGQELLPSPHHLSQWERRDSGGMKEFRPRTEGSFERIIRYGTSPKNYFWVVTDKSGTKYYYGTYTGTGSISDSLPKDSSGNIGRWPLCRVEDMDGNDICYFYSLLQQTDANGVYIGQQLWLESIVYNGNRKKGEPGKYRVLFGSRNCADANQTEGDGNAPSGKGRTLETDSTRRTESGKAGNRDCDCDVHIHVIKTDRCSGNPVAGAGFTLDDGQQQSSAVTDAAGEVHFQNITVPCGWTFRLQEVSPVSGYAQENVELEIMADANCSLQVISRTNIDNVVWNTPNDITVYVSNEPECTARVEVVKTNHLTHEPVKGTVFELERDGSRRTDTTNSQGRIVWQFPFSCNSIISVREKNPAAGYALKTVLASFHYGDFCRLELSDRTGIDSIRWLPDGTCRIHVSNMPRYNPPHNADSIENSVMKQRPDVNSAVLCPCGSGCGCEGSYPPDYRTEARSGYLQSCRDKLCRIVVYYGDSLVRAYSFCYGSDIFGRAQLRKILQWGADCSAAPYVHELEYYEDGSAANLLDNSPTTINGVSGQTESGLGLALHELTRPLEVAFAAFGGPTLLSANRNGGLGASGGADVGPGENSGSKETSFSLTAGSSPRYGRGLGTLIDIDGDGRPDRVFRNAGKVFYQPQTSGGFGAKQQLSGFSDFLRDQSSGFNCGASANFVLQGGVSWNRTSSKTTVYFCDINGDGLLDLVHDNACDGVTPMHFPPTFVADGCGVRVEQNSEAVIPCVSMDGVPDPDTVGMDAVSWPFYDLVRVWSNEKMKDIRLSAIMAEACLDPMPIEDAVETDDTLILSVEFYGRTLHFNYPATYHFLIAETMIRPGECVWNGDLLSGVTPEIPFDQVDLDTGCLILFRARSLHGRPVSHLLHWNPEVHTNASYPAGVYTHENPASASDFPRASDSLFICPATGTLRIEVRDIDAQYHGVYDGRRRFITNVDAQLSVHEGDTLMFMAVGNSATLWQNHLWHPYVYYKDVTVDNASTNMLLVDPANNAQLPTFGFYPTPYYRCYRASQGIFPKSLPHPVFGTMYGGWGAFQYRHSESSLMDTVKLFAKSGLPSGFHFNTDSYDMMDDTSRTCNFADSTALVLDSLTRCLDVIPLTPDNGANLNRGLFPNAYVHNGGICLGYMTDEPLDEEEPAQPGCGLLQAAAGGSAALRKAYSHSGNVRLLSYGCMDKVSVSDGFSISFTKPSEVKMSVTKSIRNRSRMTQDLMDMNGDGVPDFIREGRVYCSRPDLGGWEFSPRMFIRDGHHLSKSNSRGLNFSARVALPVRKSAASGKGSSVISCTAGIGGSLAGDTVLHTLADINGDGLPDLVYNNGKVRLNTGYGFTGERTWSGLEEVGVHYSSGSSGSGSDISFWKDAISGGVNITLSRNGFIVALQDINGDGLPDLVGRSTVTSSILYRMNTGNGFRTTWTYWKPSTLYPSLEWDKSSSVDLNANYTAGGLFFGFKWGGSIGADGSVTVSNSQMQIMDFDGNGLPDLLISTDNSTLQVHYANLGRTGLLKAVTNPLGGSVTMDYSLTQANVYHSRRWVMTKVVTHDSLPGDGCDSLRLRIRYDHGYYDRTEREFLGFAVVVSEPLDGSGNALRTNIQYYDNRSVHAKGSPLCEALVRIQGTDTTKYIITTYSYDTSHIMLAGSALHSVFPKLTRRQTCFFEGLPQAQVTAWEEYDYENTFGNVTQRLQGSTDQPTVSANISWHPQYNGNYCVNKVASVEITGYRKRTTEVDSKGHYTVFKDWYSTSQYLATRLQYDDYGNITTMRGPNTTVHYTYDNYVHSYPTAITDTFGVTSQMQNYDFRFGVPRTIIDQAESRMEYTLDEWGRTATIRGPKEIASGADYIIRYTYAGREAAPTGSTRQRAVSMAMTENYDPEHPQNPIKTYTYCDGLGRIVQTRKEAEIGGVEKLVVSGHTVVDALGRTVASYYPTEIHKDSTRFRFIVDGITPSTATYDVMDRPLVQTAPDGSTTTFSYGFNGSHLNKMLFSTTTTDANNHVSTELKDVEGKPWAVQAAGQQFVYFNYNPVGDNIKVYSAVANDWERNYTYDLLGRRLTYTEGELAESYTYNGGNLAAHSQSWLENGNTQTKTTTYHYNAHRLDSVGYDDALTTIYHYDQYSRVDSLYDESGVVCYQYGNMGEVTQETRIYALPFLSQPIALSTQFTYDSWGRIQDITYPDNEVVNYTYDCGGQLFRFYNNGNYSYLDSVKYDRFGAKTSQKYGNGLKTNYSYDNLTRRLTTITTLNGNSQISTFAYTYDPVGNVTQVTSSCPWRNNQTFTESFTYAAADQLTAAQSVVSGQPSVSNYQLAVTYGNWGKISSYGLTQRDMQHNSTQSETQAYTYPSYNSIGNSQTLFAPAQRTITDANNNVATETLTFGINGSLRRRDVQAQNSFTEYYLFNSAANLKAYSNNGLDFAYYGYNASNTRAYKLSFLNQNQWVNGQPEPLDLQLQSAMFYPNAYLNFNHNGEYTKHYYNGAERIASRLGSNTHPTDATSNDRLEYRMMREEEKFRENIQELVSDGQPVDFQGTVDLNSLQPVNATSDIFYYHTNHLGSTAYVTDNNATITQGFLYAPFGEITTEYNANFGNNVLPKYSFNAKELDEETGMYYYEARYYAPPVFVSRDPHFERYFWTSPYGYCNNNPLKYVDPTGMDWYQDAEGNVVFNKDVNENTKLGEGEKYIGKTANWFGQTEQDMQYLYHGAEDGSLIKEDMTVPIYGNKDGSDSHYGVLNGISDYYGAASKAWCNTKNRDKSKSLYTLKKKGMLGTAKPGQTKRGWDKFAKTTGKRIGRLCAIGSAADVTYSVYLDGGSFGENTSGSVGAAAGGWIGARAGAYIGGGIGSFICPGVGTAIGAGLGSIIGGISGGLGGDALGKKLYK